MALEGVQGFPREPPGLVGLPVSHVGHRQAPLRERNVEIVIELHVHCETSFVESPRVLGVSFDEEQEPNVVQRLREYRRWSPMDSKVASASS